jgi:C-terminal processing protease CtpA/Prc
MIKRILPLIAALVTLHCQAQKPGKFNLGFEDKKADNTLSEGWIKWGDYSLTIDSISNSGNYSGKITSSGPGTAFGSIAYKIPANFSGKTIKLEGHMKIRNVANGFAGLLLRVDGQGQALAFDNMQHQKISGTREWQQYSITLLYPENAEQIYVAGVLSGKGEAWFDDFVVTIDGQDVQTMKEVQKEFPKAYLDKEFEKGTSITFPPLTTKQVGDLELLGRIWGFLKYHHPEIAKGNFNWDYELFRFLPNYLTANDKTGRDSLLIRWIASLGEIKTCKDCITVPENAILKPDFAWIENQHAALKEALWHIYKNRSSSKHHYVDMHPTGNPDFKNENPYTEMPYPDSGFRLLSLFRYWNMINYFFPYKHLMDKDWDLTLKEYIPVFLAAQNELEYELAVLRIIATIQDTHANLWAGGDKISQWKGVRYPPFHTRFIEGKLTITDYYNPELQETAGLKIGDIIHKVNGKPVDSIIAEWSVYYPASNHPAQLRNMALDMLRSNDKEIRIECSSENAVKQSKLLRLYPRDSLKMFDWYKEYTDRSYRLLSNNIGYITLQTITDDDMPQIKDTFKNTKGIIIDIRNYPSAFVPFTLGSYFVSSATPFVKFTKGSITTPGSFTFAKDITLPNTGQTYDGPVVVMVNELTQSAAEYTAMAFRAGKNTTIIGSTTAGADGNISAILLPGGLRTMISGIGVYYPDGKETQRIGIVPDIEVKPTVEGIRNGKDELLEKAIELILKK